MIPQRLPVASRSCLIQIHFIAWTWFGSFVAFSMISWSPYLSYPGISFVTLRWHRLLISLIPIHVLSITLYCSFSQRDKLKVTLPTWNLTKIATARKVTRKFLMSFTAPSRGQPRRKIRDCGCSWIQSKEKKTITNVDWDLCCDEKSMTRIECGSTPYYWTEFGWVAGYWGNKKNTKNQFTREGQLRLMITTLFVRQPAKFTLPSPIVSWAIDGTYKSQAVCWPDSGRSGWIVDNFCRI